jgi:proteasome lid subunit RPN8/RPN11
MEIHTLEIVSWPVPECPFTIEYSPRVLDDIRLTVVDAFFSLPRGGAEIGGILLGGYGGTKVTITGFLALECEHALGPSFTLSPRDEAQLSDLLGSPECRRRGCQPVGWYHSHTRSEIFLSDTDLEIYNRYFPEPWQVALLLKPHTFLPTRAGFFFREPDGTLRAASSYREFALEPLPMRPPAASPPLKGPARTVQPQGDETAEIAAAEATVDSGGDGTPVPKFLLTNGENSWRKFKRLLAVAIGLAIGCIAFQTRDLWLFPAISLIHASPAIGPGALGLNAVEIQGQMQIRWNPHASKVRNASSGLLEILDGSAIPRGVMLDADHLLSGVFSYARQSERVDVTLDLQQPDGKKIREATTFLGQNPAAGSPNDTAALTAQVKKLEAELATQVERNQKLEKDLAKALARLRAARRTKAPDQTATQP